MSSASAGVDGVSAMLGRMQAAANRGPDGARKGLLVAAQNTLNVSNKRVPHEEGDLERDGAASVADDQLLAAVAYGRSETTAPYAVVQHERMDYEHDDGRQAKFLETAFAETADQNAQIIAAHTRAEVEGGGA